MSRSDIRNKRVPSRLSKINIKAYGLDSFKIDEKYRVLKKYVKRDDVDSQLAGMAISDGLTLDSTSIYSCIETNREALSVIYAIDYKSIVAAQVDGCIRLYNARDLKTIAEIKDSDVFLKAPCTCVRHRPLSKYFTGSPNITCTYANGFVKCWDSDTSKCLYTINENRQTYNLNYHPRMPKFVTVGEDSRILLYDEESKTLERIFKGDALDYVSGHTSRVFAVVFNPASNHEFITGGWDDVICYWDVRQPAAVKYISGPHVCGSGLDISPDGKIILSCAYQQEKQMALWDYATGGLILQKSGDDGFNTKLYCTAIVSASHAGCGGTAPNLFRLIDRTNLETRAIMRGMAGAVYSMDKGDPNRKRSERLHSVLLEVPRILISSGKRIYQLDFT